jgi:hypothetical protein
MTDTTASLRTLLDRYLACPTAPALDELEDALRGYQTEWIRTRAGADAPPADAPAKAAVPKARFKITDADRAVLERLADGWAPTTAEVPRWAWFEDRELVRLEPDPGAGGREILRLTEEGWRTIGRAPR